MNEKLFSDARFCSDWSYSSSVSGLPILISSLYASLWIWLPAIFSFVAIRMALKQNLVQTLRNE